MASACAPALATHFVRLGGYDQAAAQTMVVVPIADDVKVHYLAVPDGLRLTDQGMVPMHGSPHLVLGEVRVLVNRCDQKLATRHGLLRALQEQAFQAGANALVNASVLLEERFDEAACEQLISSGQPAGTGWAVILVDKPADS